jgi:hypothetical protein
VTRDRRLLGADFILRRYLTDLRQRGAGSALFLGLGAGAAEISFPTAAGSGNDTWYTYVVEAGYEYSPDASLALVGKGQWRHFAHAGRDYSGWSLHFGVGIPLPW